MLEQNGARRAVLLYVIWFVCVFTAVPAFFNRNLPLDVIEQIAWGRQLQFGYWKHPYLVPWLSNPIAALTPHDGWTIYLLSAVLVGIGLLFLYRLGKSVVGARASAAAVLLTAGIYYFTLPVPEFNQNIVLLALWPIAAYYGLRVLQTGATRHALLLGVFAGALIVAKYTGLLWATAYLIYLLCGDERKILRRKRFYWTLPPALLLTLPNFIWLVRHRFISVTYAMDRSHQGVSAWYQHIVQPLTFGGGMLLAVAPCLILFAPLFFCRGHKKSGTSTLEDASRARARRYIAYLFCLPVGITLLLSAMTGDQMRSMWATPFAALLPIYLFVLFPRATVSDTALRRLLIVAVAVLTLWGAAYVVARDIVPKRQARYERTSFPGQVLAEKAMAFWRLHAADGEPSVIAGPVWLAGNIAYYGASDVWRRPYVFIDYSFAKSPWITPALLRKRPVLGISPGACAVLARSKDSVQTLARRTVAIEQKPYCLVLSRFA